jgi:uncharacterized protein YqeY
MDTNPDGDAIRVRLELALRAAIKARDTVAVSALRSVLAAIANTEAVPQPTRSATPTSEAGAPSADGAASSQHVAGGATGLGAAEADRKTLTGDETAALVRAEIVERQAAARQYEDAGHQERADRLLRETRIIQAALEAH